MRLLTSPTKQVSARQLSIAAENIAAAQFALHGFDVLEHAGRGRILYDLGVAKYDGMLKVAVHGSLDGFWNLVDPYLDMPANGRVTRADYHRAIDRWLERHSNHITCCLVQFASSDLTGMPRIYLASAEEVAQRLHGSTEKLGDSALYEQYEITDEAGAHSVEQLPSDWLFSAQRIAELMEAPMGKRPLAYRISEAATCMPCAASDRAACVMCLPMMN